MKKTTIKIAGIALLFACGQAETTSEGWTENQEIHFYTDCKQKMIDQGENEENSHAFCECCLLKLKDQFSDGKQAMQNLTDADIQRIEDSCSEKN